MTQAFDGLSKYLTGKIGQLIRRKTLQRKAKNCGKNIIVDEGVFIGSPENLEIGSNCTFRENTYIECAGGLKIGNDVRIAPMVSIYTQDHQFNNTEKPIWTQGFSSAPITIEDDVWIGTKATILKGTRIGKGAIIAANSVVTANSAIPPYTIWGGIPARQISDRKNPKNKQELK